MMRDLLLFLAGVIIGHIILVDMITLLNNDSFVPGKAGPNYHSLLRSTGSADTWVLGEDSTRYFYNLGKPRYRWIDKANQCPGFNPLEPGSWCSGGSEADGIPITELTYGRTLIRRLETWF